MLYRIRQRDVINGDFWIAAVVVGNQEQILTQAGTVTLRICCADFYKVVAVLDSPDVAVRKLNLPLILLDTALPGSAVQRQFNRSAGGKVRGGAGEENAVDPLLVTHCIVAGNGIQCQRR